MLSSGGGAEFDFAHFGRSAVFSGAGFNGVAGFDCARFNGMAYFCGVQFDQDVSFANAQFGDVMFDDAQFNGATQFSGARFKGNARFKGAKFIGEARFCAKFNGDAEFDDVQFTGDTWFSDAEFSGDTEFQDAQFGGHAAFYRTQFGGPTGFNRVKLNGDAQFGQAQFNSGVDFGRVHFSQDTDFKGAQFKAGVGFDYAQFSRAAGFDDVQFDGDTGFGHVRFSGDTYFGGSQFNGDAWFSSALFENAASLGPLRAGSLHLDRAVFVASVVLETSAGSVTCTGTTWEAGVTMRLRYATVDLERATFTVPSSVTGADQPFELPNSIQLDESKIAGHIAGKADATHDSWVPGVLSMRGVDAFNLSVIDVDLSQCQFAGARLLDQLRLEGRCIFGRPPQGPCMGWAWPPVWRWSSRQCLAEESTWRASTPKHARWADVKPGVAQVRPERLAALYRQLRKAQEDAKNEPGAADFYYGEMEMRRHARSTPAPERAIICLYWLISGYGLRALRSLVALVLVGAVVTAALTGWGLAAITSPQQLAGTVTTTPHKPARINATLRVIGPQLPPASQRWTAERTQTALEVTFESVAFRTPDRPLTAAGRWITIIARILGPLLLALTLLAIRNRIKR